MKWICLWRKITSLKIRLFFLFSKQNPPPVFTCTILVINLKNYFDVSVSVPIDNSIHELDDYIILERNIEASAPTNIETSPVFNIDIRVTACIEQILPGMFCMYDTPINVEQ